MKFKTFLFFTFAVLCLFTSCHKKQKALNPEDYIQPASQVYSSQDSAEIKYLVKTYLGYFNKGNYAGCADMLYTFKNDSVLPYSVDKKKEFSDVYSHLPIFGTQQKGIILRDDRNNQVDIAVQIAPQANYDTGEGTITISLNPVQVKGKWYLTLRDKDADGTKDVYKNEADKKNYKY